MKHQLLLAGLLLILLVACTKTDNPPNITGNWEEQESSNFIQFAGSTHVFEFKADSFFLSLRYWTDMIDVNAPCPHNRTEYIRGTYELTEDMLSISGKYTDETFVTEQATCDGELDYEASYEYVYEVGELLLNPEQEEYFQIRLLEQ